MNTVDVIADAVRSTGYRDEAIVRDYAFADVLDPDDTIREVVLAAFTQTPPSYRSAAIAAVPAPDGATPELVRAHRALGAPLLFVIEPDQLSLWQVRGDFPRRMHEAISVQDVPALFERYRESWHPDSIHRAKSIAAVDQVYQLDFVDLGLLTAVEGEIHSKLDRLLVDTLSAASSAQSDTSLDTRLLFRVVFRLLAAKVLQDRRHPYAQLWDADDLTTILSEIESYYSLPPVDIYDGCRVTPEISAAWHCLRHGISFANISSDDLAFVYENTLVTPEARKLFGTHSTPRQLAEYAVTRLALHRYPPTDLHIYEPFAGAGVFLVSALRHMRELLPVDWDDQRRHDFLINHLAGDEVDAFACEVAMLSLILADYPNRNGWQVIESDLFKDERLQLRLQDHNVVLCNPPFPDFTSDERRLYALGATAFSKPIEVLNSVLDACPHAFAVVLPRAFILDKKFAQQRKLIEELYSDIEIVELPDRLFQFSGVESSLVIAQNRRSQGHTITNLCSTEVSDQTRLSFLKTGNTTRQRRTERPIGDTPAGDLWIQNLHHLWDYLQPLPRLGGHFRIHRGIEWQSNQERAWSTQAKEGYRRGLHTARKSRQFLVPPTVWLDCQEERLRGGAINLPWEQRKLVANAGRLSRGPWRIGAALDKEGLLCSQQFFGCWPTEPLLDTQLLSFAAVLNGPIANAYLATHSPAKGIRISAVTDIPVPSMPVVDVGDLVVEYLQCLEGRLMSVASSEQAQALLMQIDAAVLGAYDLPRRLEKQLLDYFRDVDRPLAHAWQHWDDNYPLPGLTLAERVSRRSASSQPKIQDVFQPLPGKEANLLRTYGT